MIENDGTSALSEASSPAPTMDWYIVHTYSGFEDRVVQELTNRIKAQGMEAQFGEIRVPKETVVEMKAGKRRNVERKFFPGYVLVQMEMADETWHLVRNTPKVTGFVGGSSKSPVPLMPEEVEAILHHTAESKEKPKPTRTMALLPPVGAAKTGTAISAAPRVNRVIFFM